jgi:hypothetical protein
MVTATLTREYAVTCEPGDILALPHEGAILLSRWDRSLYVLQDGQIHEVPLTDPMASKHSLAVDNHTFHQGALFPYRDGFGALFADTIYLWEIAAPRQPDLTLHMDRPTVPPERIASPWPSRTGETIWIDRPHQPQRLAPLAASAVPDQPESTIVALLNGPGALYEGRYLARLSLTDGAAVWEDRPHDLAYDDFAALVRPAYEYPRDERLFSEIIDLLSLSATTVRVHSVGKPKRYAAYGMDFSALADVDGQWTSTPIATLDRGFGTFSTDRRWLLLQGLRGKPRIRFYTVDGHAGGRLNLGDNVMGHVQNVLLRVDLSGETLWLTDTYGAVACSTITSW